MPITLITGAPGNGKTLLLLWEVERRRLAEKREVYQSGIADLNLPWHQFGEEVDKDRPHMTDASKWNALPVGCIIVIDEAQRLFRARSVGSKVPDYVEALETHRHKGYDIYLVTQGPGLIDSNVRNLVETHKHLMRKFGSTWATIHEFKGVRSNVMTSRKDSQESQFKYPKEVYSWYKSAEVHTVKRRIPPKVMLLMGLPVVLLLAAAYALHVMGRFGDKPTESPAAAQRVVASSNPQAAGSLPGANRGPLGPAEYGEQFLPRFPDSSWSAPRYDSLTKPVRVPVVVGCVLIGTDRATGFCITQQGTTVKPGVKFMRDFVDNGAFVDFEPEAMANKSAPGAASPMQQTQFGLK
jgi:zona occludens toxin